MEWQKGISKRIDLQPLSQFKWAEELEPSPDGEHVAVIVNTGDEENVFDVWVDGNRWGKEYDRVWFLLYSPDNRLTAIVSELGENTLAVDGKEWDEKFGFVWDTRFSQDGKHIAVAIQKDMRYGMAIDGSPWENLFENANNFALSNCGQHTAAVVQVVSLGQADVFTFKQGCFTVAVDGKPWEKKFVSVWSPRFDPTGQKVAAQVRPSVFEYTIAVDGEPWPITFNSVWEPVFHPKDGSVFAPVRVDGKWGLAKDGKIIWQPKYVQLWQLQFNQDGDVMTGIAAPEFGKWTVVVNNKPWQIFFKDLVTDVSFDPQGKTIAALGKNGQDWFVAVNGEIWDGSWDMAWKPVVSPNGEHVVVKVEKDKKYTLVINGHKYHESFDQLWNPVFSPDSQKIMLRYVKKGVYYKEIVEF